MLVKLLKWLFFGRKACRHNMVQVVPEYDRWKCVWCGYEERHKNLNDIL